MSCPDWQTLAAWRDDPQADEPAEWREALAHLDRGCSQCRRAAIAADPTLVFRRLTVVAAPSPAQEASEAEAMRRAVAAMRAASRVEAVERRRGWSWKRWASAAALAVVALSMPADDARLRREPAGLAPLAAALPAALPDGSLETGQALLGDDLPTLDGGNRPNARVYHVDGEGLSGTMIFDETLDV